MFPPNPTASVTTTDAPASIKNNTESIVNQPRHHIIAHTHLGLVELLADLPEGCRRETYTHTHTHTQPGRKHSAPHNMNVKKTAVIDHFTASTIAETEATALDQREEERTASLNPV